MSDTFSAQRILALLVAALTDTQRLKIPKAGQIETIMRRMGWRDD